MDATTKDAFNNVRKLARYFESLQDVIKAFDTIERAEQLVGENEARVARLKAESDRLEKTIAANAEQAAGVLRDAHAAAEAITLAADTYAADKRAEGDNIVASARVKAKTLTDKAEDSAAKASALAADAEAQRTAAAEELATLEAKIAKAQQQIANLLGS